MHQGTEENYFQLHIAPYLIRIAALVLISLAVYWVYNRYTHVSVSDARIAATMISVSTRVSGLLVERSVEEGQVLARGALIARIDPRDALLALKEAQADLAAKESEWERVRAEKQLATARIEATIKRVQSQVSGARSSHQANLAELTRAEAEWQRAIPLFEKEILAREVWEKKHNIYQQAQQSAEVSKAQIHTQQAALEEARVASQELAVYDSQLTGIRYQIEQARAHVARLDSSLSDHSITSPIEGVIDEVFVDAAEYVTPGQRLLIMHDPADVWVSANIKETDLRHLRVGSTAMLRVDAFPSILYKGVIERIGSAATSQFALLPNPNPSGNFTKITQRFEVRIRVEQEKNLLKPGMMVEVEFDAEPESRAGHG